MASSSIDLSENWRWACPECDSVSVKRNSGDPNRGKARVARKTSQRGKVENFRAPRAYRCAACSASFDAPIDRKTGEVADQ